MKKLYKIILLDKLCIPKIIPNGRTPLLLNLNQQNRILVKGRENYLIDMILEKDIKVSLKLASFCGIKQTNLSKELIYLKI